MKKNRKLPILIILPSLLALLSLCTLRTDYQILSQNRLEVKNRTETTICVRVWRACSERRLHRLADRIVEQNQALNFDLGTDVYHIRFYTASPSPELLEEIERRTDDTARTRLTEK